VRNGNFQEPPTSGAEYVERGGLGTAAWLPIRVQPSDNGATGGVVEKRTETVGNQTISAAVINREGADRQFARVGLRQEINAPASFLRQIELEITVKLVRQAEAPGGPRGDVYPLTVSVLYTDPNGKQQQWNRSFYISPEGDLGLSNATRVQPFVWVTPDQWDPEHRTAVLRQVGAETVIGQDIDVINAIEIYGIGTEFQSWVTDVALMAR
jgi:hypothetical protein